MKAKKLHNSQKHCQILGTRVDGTSPSGVLNFIGSSLKKKKKFLIVTPNPEILTYARVDSKLKDSLNGADLSVADGVGLKLAAAFNGYKDLEVIPGRSLLLSILKARYYNRSLKVFLLGSTPLVINKCLQKIDQDYKGVSAQGFAGPRLNNDAEPSSKEDTKLQKEAIKRINEFSPDIVFIAFGAPKQEKWAHRWLPKLKVGGAMVVGGALDYFAGTKPLPPKFIAAAHCEWAWRMIHEKGHIRRVVRALVEFPALVIGETLGFIK